MSTRKTTIFYVLLAMTASLRRSLEADPDVSDPRRYLAPARLAMRDEVLRLLEVLG